MDLWCNRAYVFGLV